MVNILYLFSALKNINNINIQAQFPPALFTEEFNTPDCLGKLFSDKNWPSDIVNWFDAEKNSSLFSFPNNILSAISGALYNTTFWRLICGYPLREEGNYVQLLPLLSLCWPLFYLVGQMSDLVSIWKLKILQQIRSQINMSPVP